MSIQEYVSTMKNIYSMIYDFLNEEEEENDLNYQEIQNIIEKEKIFEDFEEATELMILINKISKHHHRKHNFIEKIEKILLKNIKAIKQTFSNFQIFDFFKNNKLILIFLFHQSIITVDDDIFNHIMKKRNNYILYFFNEIKDFLSSENQKLYKNQLLTINPNIFENFLKKCQEGENENYLCSLIRNDSVEEFIIFISRTNLSLSTVIRPSIFETNSFLIKRKPTLIEYAAFYGSIQIFNYLRYNNVEMNSNLWLYAIHSNNAEMIHLLEEINIEVEDKTYEKCLKESIKCHHNEITKYINDNLLTNSFSFEQNQDQNQDQNSIKNGFKIFNSIKNIFTEQIEFEYNEINKTIFSYHNYEFMPNDIIKVAYFIYFVEFDYIKLVKFFYPNKRYKIDLNKKLTSENISNNQTLMQIACQNNNKDIIYYFLSESKEIFSTQFCDFYKLHEITIPSSVTYIGSYAFNGCSALSQITFEQPSSLTKIDYYAFSECSNLEQIILPSSITSIGTHAFFRCRSLKRVFIESTSSSQLNKKSSLQKYLNLNQIFNLKSISNSAFSECQSLIEVSIPPLITQIGFQAFSNCESLKHISIPSSVISFDGSVFCACPSLEEITIPSSIKTIGKGTFQSCTSLKKITFEEPSSLTLIEDCAFNECSSLIEIILPSSVKTIGKNAFDKCYSLKRIEIPSSIKKINEYTFNECSSLDIISIPSSVTFISDYSFYECSSLTKVTILSSAISIGKCAFRECSSLTKIEIPSSITSIEYNPFVNCVKLDQIIIIPCDEKRIDYFENRFLIYKSRPSNAFYDVLVWSKQTLNLVTIPEFIKTIGSAAFFECSSLTQITIPSSVTSIGTSAFQECSSLKQVTFSNPSSVISIGNYAFRSCSSLTQMTIPSSVTEIGHDAFCDCSSLKQIIIPYTIVLKLQVPPDTEKKIYIREPQEIMMRENPDKAGFREKNSHPL